MMAYFMPGHRNVLHHGSSIAERIVCKEMCWNVKGIYDIKTLAEFDNEEPKNGVFAQLLRIDPERTTFAPHRYRVCLQDTEILNFVQRNAEIDMLSFITFIMTHELLHINPAAEHPAAQHLSTEPAQLFGLCTAGRMRAGHNQCSGSKPCL